MQHSHSVESAGKHLLSRKILLFLAGHPAIWYKGKLFSSIVSRETNVFPEHVSRV